MILLTAVEPISPLMSLIKMMWIIAIIIIIVVIVTLWVKGKNRKCKTDVKCPKCGMTISEGKKFCKNCGTKVE